MTTAARATSVTVRMTRLALVITVVMAACGGDRTFGLPDPGGASYSRAFDPAVRVDSTATCDRFATYAIVSLGSRVRGFDLSINLYDNCTRSGGGYTFWETLILGDYTFGGRELLFTPDDPSMAPFPGTFDAWSVRLTVPAADSLGPLPLVLDLNNKYPF